MPTHLFRLACLLLSVFLAACGPSRESAESAVAEYELNLQKGQSSDEKSIPRPPELVRALGVGVNDQRAAIIFLQAAGKRSFGVFQRNLLSAQVGAQKGYKVTSFDASDDPDTQRKQFAEAAASKPAAIILDPTDDGNLDAHISDAVQAGILVIGLDKRASGCTSTVHCDPQAIGRVAATLCIDALKRKAAEEALGEPTGRIVQLRGAENSWWSGQIAQGFQQALRAQSGAVLVHDAPADWTAENVSKRLQEAFRIQKQFDVIFAHSDLMAAAASTATSAAGSRENSLIIGTDGLPGRSAGLDLLRNGEIDATIAHPPLVDLALKLILRIRSDSSFTPEPTYEMAPLAVTPKNHAAVSRQGSYSLPDL